MVDISRDTAERIAREIQWLVADHFKITSSMLLRRSRKRTYSYPRMFAMYLIREVTGGSFPWIAKHFNVHHSTIMHACEWAELQYRDNDDYRQYIEYALKKFKDRRDAMERQKFS